MPAWNPANVPTVQAQPVTAFYQGKAMRQELAMGAKNLEQADEKLEFERQRVEIAQGELGIRQEALDAKKSAQQNAEGAAAAAAIYDTWGELEEGERDKYALDKFTEIHGAMEDGKDKDALGKAIEDGKISKAEMEEFGREAYNILGKEMPQYAGVNPFSKINPKDYTPESVRRFQESGDFSHLEKAPDAAAQPDFEPVTKNEVDAAMAIVESDPQLDDIDTKNEKIVAAQYIANETRQLQANEGLPYDEAVAMAAAKLKAKLKKDDDYFTPKEEKLNIAEDPKASGLEHNEYLIDGTVWVEEPDGSIHPRD